MYINSVILYNVTYFPHTVMYYISLFSINSNTRNANITLHCIVRHFTESYTLELEKFTGNTIILRVCVHA